MSEPETQKTPFETVLDAFQLAGMGLDGDVQVLVERGTGRTILRSEFADFDEELPANADSDDWVQLPTTRELGLAKPLALEFARIRLPSDLNDVRDIFSRRGAFRAFDDLLLRRAVRDAWRTFPSCHRGGRLEGLVQGRGPRPRGLTC